MIISLTPEMEQFVKLMLDSGKYDSVTDVLREGLKLLEKRDNQEKLVWLRAEIQKGMDELEAGHWTDGEEAKLSRRELLFKIKKKQDATSLM